MGSWQAQEGPYGMQVPGWHNLVRQAGGAHVDFILATACALLQPYAVPLRFCTALNTALDSP